MTWVARRGELIAIVLGADVARRLNGERIAGDQSQRLRIVVEQFPDEVQRPWIIQWPGHGGEPNLPVNPRLVRRDKDPEARRVGRERSSGSSRKRLRIVMEQFPDEVQRPWIIQWPGHGGEPNLPVNPRLVRRDKDRAALRIAGFGLELVFLPLGPAGDKSFVSAFENNLVAHLADTAERAVRVH